MNKVKQHYSHQWRNRKATETVKLQRLDPRYSFETTQITKERFTTFEGTFLIEVDIDQIAQTLMTRASGNHSGKSAFMHGACRAQLLSAKAMGTEDKECNQVVTEWASKQ